MWLQKGSGDRKDRNGSQRLYIRHLSESWRKGSTTYTNILVHIHPRSPMSSRLLEMRVKNFGRKRLLGVEDLYYERKREDFWESQSRHFREKLAEEIANAKESLKG